MPDADADLALLTGAAEAAGEIALEAFGGDYESWEKPGQGPVTAADLAVDRMLRAELAAARPDYGWLSEESGGDEDLDRRQRGFIVDPIDGTRAFMSGQARRWPWPSAGASSPGSCACRRGPRPTPRRWAAAPP